LNKKRWVYVGEGGRRTTVGMLHNISKGQFMIYSGKKIVLVDFKVYDSKTYSFFLDEELCKIEVVKTDEGFEYQFGIDTDAETPLNQERKAIRKSDRKKSILAIVGLLALAALLVGGALMIHSHFLEQERINNGAFSTGIIHITPLKSSYSLSYSFGTARRTFARQIEYYSTPNPKSPNGLPLFDNDQFYVQYARRDPTNNVILFDRPTEQQLEVYKERSMQVYLREHPAQDSVYCSCLLDVAYELKGLEGYAHFYYQALPPSKNKKYNLKTYKELLISEEFMEQTKACNPKNN
jgi:hypothetical protein